MAQDALLDECLNELQGGYERAAMSPPSHRSVAKIFDLLRDTENETANADISNYPEICQRLLPTVPDLPSAFAALAPRLNWYHRQAPGHPEFEAGHANAFLVGPGGMANREDVWIGVSLLGPGVTYPDHNHPPEETYLTLSPGWFRNDDRNWTWLEAGQTWYNPPGITHAMRAADSQALLVMWVLLPG